MLSTEFYGAGTLFFSTGFNTNTAEPNEGHLQ